MASKKLLILCLLGAVRYSLSCSECKEVENANDPVIFQYLSNTLQDVSIIPDGLQSNEKIKLVKVLKAAYLISRGVKYYYEFEGTGQKTNYFFKCNLEIIRKAWLNERDIKQYQCHLELPRN